MRSSMVLRLETFLQKELQQHPLKRAIRDNQQLIKTAGFKPVQIVPAFVKPVYKRRACSCLVVSAESPIIQAVRKRELNGHKRKAP